VQLHFSVNLQETRLFIRRFSTHATVLTNTKQLPIGQSLNTSGVHLVNLQNYQKICRIHGTLIKSFTKGTPLMFYQALEASGGFLIIYQLQLAWI
jgi:hypothetical protein